MSHTAFADFLQHLNNDEHLRERLHALGQERDKLGPEELVDFGAGEGYEFTVEDMERELSDSELESVAGGVLTGTALFSMLPIDQDVAWKKKPAKK